MTEYNYTALYKTTVSNGLHDCQTQEQAINLLTENQKKKGITPIAVIKKSTNEMVWHNQELGKEYCKKFIENFDKR